MFKKFKEEKSKFYNEYKRILNSDKERFDYTTLGKQSILIFIFLIFFSFLFIGSSYGRSNVVLLYVGTSMRVISILIGLVFIYVGIYLLILQRKINNKYIFYLALIIGLFSTVFYLFVSYYTILEIF